MLGVQRIIAHLHQVFGELAEQVVQPALLAGRQDRRQPPDPGAMIAESVGEPRSADIGHGDAARAVIIRIAAARHEAGADHSVERRAQARWLHEQLCAEFVHPGLGRAALLQPGESTQDPPLRRGQPVLGELRLGEPTNETTHTDQFADRRVRR